MKPSEMLKRIQTLLNTRVELEDRKLDNGTVIFAEEFAEGQPVFIVTEDERIPMPVGEYMMEDGKSLIIEDEGIIAEIKDLEEEEAPAEEEVEAEKEDMGYVTKEELAEAVSEIKAMIEDMKKEEMSEEEATENEVELSEDLKAELSEPAAEPIAHNPEKTNNFNVKFAQNRKPSTLDRVLSKINN